MFHHHEFQFDHPVFHFHKKQQVTILDENGTEITFSKLKDIQVKKFQKIKQGDTIALYQQKFKMIFEYLGKQITYQEYLGM